MVISRSDQLGLIAFSNGKCYYPGCEEPIVRLIDGTPALNANIAHISGVTPESPRFSASMSTKEANSFSNLILLCLAHHAVVDRLASDRYTAALLRSWKEEREAPLSWTPPERILEPEPSDGLREAAERHLQDLLSESYESTNFRIDDALTEFEKLNAEAADALRALFRSFPNPSNE